MLIYALHVSSISKCLNLEEIIDIIYNNLATINSIVHKIYYDALYNRGSDIIAFDIGNVICNLNIVKPIIPITSQLEK